jgi:hypothetical protein
MRKFLAVSVLIVAATTLVTASTASAESAGKVTVFSTEFAALSVWDNPTGCVKLPFDAHVLVNQTDRDIQLHGDPFCLTPGPSVLPGFGSHVAPGSGAFSVAR